MRKKLYIYDSINLPIHDSIEEYKNAIPFCNKGIEENFDITSNPKIADLFYLGQFAEGRFDGFDRFNFIKEFPDKHVCDIEGDWFYNTLSEDVLNQAIFTINGLKNSYKPYLHRMFIRPTFSKNLLKLVKTKNSLEINYNKKIVFVGLNDPLNIRLYLKNFLEANYRDRVSISLNNQWLGSSNSEIHHHVFNSTILSGTFSLCPRGTGVDSVRFLESCYHGRIPIVISDNVCFGYDFPRRFYFQCNPNENYELFFESIFNLSKQEIEEYSRNAKDFFDSIVLKYFLDPTNFFMEWYNRSF